MNSIFPEIERLASVMPAEAEGDYIDSEGFLVCGRCGTRKQRKVMLMGINRIVTCMCKCESERYDREEEERIARERMARIKAARAEGIQDTKMLDCTFERDDEQNKTISDLAHKYVDHWEEMYDANQGLVLTGDVGCGKTFIAGCIANALIDKGVPVLATDFAKILSALENEKDRGEYIRSLDRYGLLIVDDLGAERQSEWALEQVYAVVNGRYKAKKPAIFTTNISAEELKNPKDVRYSRIYDRIMEMCIPIVVKGQSRRKNIAEEKKAAARKILFGGGNDA